MTICKQKKIDGQKTCTQSRPGINKLYHQKLRDRNKYIFHLIAESK